VTIDGYKVVMEKVHHIVPAYGYIVENNRKEAIAYTGDTGPTDRFWETMAVHDVKCLIMETSFPNRLEKLALASGHLTPSLLEKEIAKMPVPPTRIYLMQTAVHPGNRGRDRGARARQRRLPERGGGDHGLTDFQDGRTYLP
jgi:hypothetical protein